MEFKNLFLLSKKVDPKLLEKRRKKIHSFQARMDMQRTKSEKFADFLTENFGTTAFLFFNLIWFVVWISINQGLIPGIEIFDPFPYGLLTMIVSLEAIFLSIIVLMTQNRAEQINDLREEIDLQVNVQAEKEITKILKMVHKIYKHLGIEELEDKELNQMERMTNIEKIESTLIKESKLRDSF